MYPLLRQIIERRFTTCLHAIVGFAFVACTTTGADAVLQGFAVDPCYDPVGEGPVLIWSAEPEIGASLAQWAIRHNLTVVEHARQPVWDRQRQPVIPADDVLRDLARSYGAERILVATAEKNAHPLTYRYAGYSEGPSWLTTVYDPAITIRSIGGREPIVYWTVIARGAVPTFFWGRTLGEIVEAALEQVETRGEDNVQEKASCSVGQIGR